MGHHSDLQASLGAKPLDPRHATRARAFLAVALIPIAPDGRIGAPTLIRILARLAEHPACASLPSTALEELAQLTLRTLAMTGPSATLAAARPLLPRPEAETALALAARAARAATGGSLCPQAAMLLSAMAKRLSVSPDTLAAILDVTAMLDRP